MTAAPWLTPELRVVRLALRRRPFALLAEARFRRRPPRRALVAGRLHKRGPAANDNGDLAA